MSTNSRSTIGLKNTTKSRLDNNRAPGQCYVGSICQLIDLCEREKGEEKNHLLNTYQREVVPME